MNATIHRRVTIAALCLPLALSCAGGVVVFVVTLLVLALALVAIAGDGDKVGAFLSSASDPATYPTRGARVLGAGCALAIVGATPLLAYVAFGPADGNPIGLGLLFAATAPVAFGAWLVGLVLHVRSGPERR